MLRVLIGIFVILHGLVHLLYAGQSLRYFDLQPGMLWPDRSWVFTRFFSTGVIRWLAALALLLVTVYFVVDGIAILARLHWWRPLLVVAVTTSSLLFVLCWDGKLEKLSDQGLIAILINLGLLVGMWVLDLTGLGF